MNPTFLTVPQVERIHAKQIARFGGSPGARDLALVDSAVAQPMAMFGGVYLHDDLFLMAAAYLFYLVKNHAFVDGNKRVGLVATLLFLRVNGFTVADPTGSLYDTTIAVAEGRLSKAEVAKVLRSLATATG